MAACGKYFAEPAWGTAFGCWGKCGEQLCGFAAALTDRFALKNGGVAAKRNFEKPLSETYPDFGSRFPRTGSFDPVLIWEAASEATSIIPSCCSQTTPQAAAESCFPALLHKSVQTFCSRLLPQSCDSAPIIDPQSHVAKRLPKAAPHSCYPKPLFLHRCNLSNK